MSLAGANAISMNAAVVDDICPLKEEQITVFFDLTVALQVPDKGRNLEQTPE